MKKLLSVINKTELNFVGRVFSYLFPTSLMLGYSYSTTESWSLLFRDSVWMIIANLVIILIVGSIIQRLVYAAFTALDGLIVVDDSAKYSCIKHRLLSCVIMLAGWLPILIANLPGAVPFDGMTQLLEHFGRIPHYGHHPVFITRLYGYIVELGSNIKSYNFGVLLVIAFQVLLCLAVFSGVSAYILQTTGKFSLWLVSALFYAAFPVFGVYVSAVMKDTFYMAMATWFLLELCRFVDQFVAPQGTSGNLRNPLSMIIAGILMCLSRKEASVSIAVTIIVAAAIFYKNNRDKKRIILRCLIVLAAILAVNFAFNFVVFNIMAVPKGEISEALSIPFQQTARYVRDCSGDVTNEEKEAIDAVLPYDKLAESYNPELLDPVKGKMKSDVGMDGYMNYARTWLQMGLKKPTVYLEATLNNTYGYFYPFYKSGGVLQFSIEHGQTERWGSEELDIYFWLEDTTYRNSVIKIIKGFRNLPVVSLLFNAGTYFWIIVFLITYCIQKKNAIKFIHLVFPIMTFLVCFASPVNGSGRYILVIYSSIVVLTATIFRSDRTYI